MHGDEPANHQLLENGALGVEKILDHLAIAPCAMCIDMYAAAGIHSKKMVRGKDAISLASWGENTKKNIYIVKHPQSFCAV